MRLSHWLFWCLEPFGRRSIGRLKGSRVSPGIFSARDLPSRCRQIAAAAPGACDLSGKTTPADLAALIRRAEVAITNDSGSMHVAASLGKPMVSVFGPRSEEHTSELQSPVHLV